MRINERRSTHLSESEVVWVGLMMAVIAKTLVTEDNVTYRMYRKTILRRQ